MICSVSMTATSSNEEEAEYLDSLFPQTDKIGQESLIHPCSFRVLVFNRLRESRDSMKPLGRPNRESRPRCPA